MGVHQPPFGLGHLKRGVAEMFPDASLKLPQGKDRLHQAHGLKHGKHGSVWSGQGQGFDCFRSLDLAHWEGPIPAFRPPPAPVPVEQDVVFVGRMVGNKGLVPIVDALHRLARAGTREALAQDYVRFARAKGLSMERVVRVHVLKNIMIPIVTVTGLEFGSLIAFAIVTETIFAWPGMGKLLIDSINVLDRPVIVAYLMIIVFLFVIINLAVDILYTALDPRVRLAGAQS